MNGLPRLVQPMLATLRRQLPADDHRYGWEFKWDGVRAIAYVSGKRVRLLSRNDNDMTGSYPELAVLELTCPRIMPRFSQQPPPAACTLPGCSA